MPIISNFYLKTKTFDLFLSPRKLLEIIVRSFLVVFTSTNVVGMVSKKLMIQWVYLTEYIADLYILNPLKEDTLSYLYATYICVLMCMISVLSIYTTNDSGFSLSILPFNCWPDVDHAINVSGKETKPMQRLVWYLWNSILGKKII